MSVPNQFRVDRTHWRAGLFAPAVIPVIVLIAAGRGPSAPDSPEPPSPPSRDLPPGLRFPAVVPTAPLDVDFVCPQTIENRQKAFDLFSWSSFIALNWPAAADGRPLCGTIGENPDAPRVWETFIAAPQVFKAAGAKPDPWGGSDSTLGEKFPGIKAGQRAFYAATKAALSDFLLAGFGPLKFPAIADTNGMYVFYEIKLNKVEYDYVVSNTLYSAAGQAEFLGRPAEIDFPKGSRTTNRAGCIEVKAAWKQLGPGDDPKRFYVVSAVRVDPVTHTPSPQSIPFGLVGLHVATRTEQAQKWVWSTFEHVDNAPDVGEARLKPRYSFNDPTKAQPAEGFGYKPTNLKPVANPTTPTQITRVLNNPVVGSPWMRALNEGMQQKLAGTVWANYRLVTTQWPGPNGAVPDSVTNPVTETYIQRDSSQGSCMACHTQAVTAGRGPDSKPAPANFSYLLQMAR
jgi:hypothetical protein